MMIEGALFSILVTAVLLTISACQQTLPPATSPTPEPPPTYLRIGVADSAAAWTDLVAELYGRRQNHTILQFIPGNNETLWVYLDNGTLDAILSHHIPPDNNNWFNPVALDGLTIIVHPDNPVTDLSLAEVQVLFNGRLSNWQSLGGADQPIALVSREQGAAARTLLQQRIMAEQQLSINAQIAASNQTMLDIVAADPYAVGYEMMGNVSGVKVIMVDGRIPTPTTTADQSYPLTIPLYFVHNSPTEPTGELRAFLAWLQSEEGQEVVGERYGRVPSIDQKFQD
ncbi:MAG: hypothetical protein GY796_04555 [Chloroflexi bacterium]|nr:hypothetical protein [Chloroflexota bacterium]